MPTASSPGNTPLTTNPQSEEARAQASEQVAAEDLAVKRLVSPRRITVREVADKVYRLMPQSLIFEGERATKSGG